MTTIRLIALLRMTACNAMKPNSPISSGNRNSAPPSPIIPPSTPMTDPDTNAMADDRRNPPIGPKVLVAAIRATSAAPSGESLVTRTPYGDRPRTEWQTGGSRTDDDGGGRVVFDDTQSRNNSGTDVRREWWQVGSN